MRVVAEETTTHHNHTHKHTHTPTHPHTPPHTHTHMGQLQLEKGITNREV